MPKSSLTTIEIISTIKITPHVRTGSYFGLNSVDWIAHVLKAVFASFRIRSDAIIILETVHALCSKFRDVILYVNKACFDVLLRYRINSIYS